MLFSVVYNMAAGILNAAGNSKRSLLYLGVASITNIVLDLVLIAGCKMGVAGAAIATVIGQICACIFALILNLKKNPEIHLVFRGFRPNWRIIGSIYAIGLPSVAMMAIVP